MYLGGGSAIRDGDGNVITDTYARKDHIVNSSVVTEPGFMADARLLNPNNADSPVNPSNIANNFIGANNNIWSKVNIETWYPGASLFNSVDGLCCREKKDGTRMINGILVYDPGVEGASSKICDVPSGFSFVPSTMQAWIPALTRIDVGASEVKWVRFFGNRLEWWPAMPSSRKAFLLYFVY